MLEPSLVFWILLITVAYAQWKTKHISDYDSLRAEDK